MDHESREPAVELDGLWAQLRAEERADRLSEVAQDADRDSRIADALADAGRERERRT